MSNNPTPRIEREAEEYSNKHGYHSNGPYDTTNDLQAAYEAAATREHARAAPVVKALFAALGILELKQIEPEMAEEFRKILQTYKADQ